jgi:HAE1 family hydrophobic/amphiphilic exporter-1
VTLTIASRCSISLTLTPMLCSRFLKDEKERPPRDASTSLFERGFDALLGGYRRGLHAVLDHQFLTLCVFLLTLAATVALFIVIPRGSSRSRTPASSSARRRARRTSRSRR